MLELEGPRVRRSHPPVKAKKPPVEPSGPSHEGVALAAPTPRMTQRRFSSDDEDPPARVETFPFGPIPTDQPPQSTLSSDEEGESEEWSGPRLGLVRRGRGGGRSTRHPARRRRVANPFIQFEAEEGDDEESEAESVSPPRCALASANTQTLTTSHTSDQDSSDSSDLDDSFIVADDFFE